MNQATQLFMLTPMCEWYDEEIQDKGLSLLNRILQGMVDGEFEQMPWEKILRCEPYIYTPDEFKAWCHDLWDFELEYLEEVAGDCDIDWNKACEQYMRHMILECMSREDEALQNLSEQVREGDNEWSDFKTRMDVLINDSSYQAEARVRHEIEYREGEIKKHNKHINYIKEQIEKQQA